MRLRQTGCRDEGLGQYDQVQQQYNYGFVTQAAWRGTCGKVTITFDDKTTRFALFRFI
jgi:hypothetical protein